MLHLFAAKPPWSAAVPYCRLSFPPSWAAEAAAVTAALRRLTLLRQQIPEEVSRRQTLIHIA
jgi:hypothetical protein